MTERFDSVDACIASFPEDVQAALTETRRRIRRSVPSADERISYNIAAFTLDGNDLVSMGAGKDTLEFPLARPIPYDLIERVAARFAERG